LSEHLGLARSSRRRKHKGATCAERAELVSGSRDGLEAEDDLCGQRIVNEGLHDEPRCAGGIPDLINT
jgi:hypothetical protein